MRDERNDLRGARRLAVIVALALFAGCATPRIAPEDALPFHVAVLPVAVSVERPRSAADGPGDSADVTFALASGELSEAIARALERSCFARVTRLGAGPASEPAAGPASPEELLRGARDAGIDLVLACEVSYRPEADSSRNEKFWLNLPLYLLGGPFSYFVEDRTYRFEAHLRASLLDAHALLAGLATVEDGAAEYVYTEAATFERDLGFWERADAWHHYLLSLLVPVGLLAVGTESVSEALEERIASDLADELARNLYRRSSALFAPGDAAEFYLGRSVRAVREGGALVVRGEARRSSSSRSRLAAFAVGHAGESVRGDLDEPAAGPGARAGEVGAPFEARVPAGDDDWVRVRLEAIGRDRRVRTFTLRLGDS